MAVRKPAGRIYRSSFSNSRRASESNRHAPRSLNEALNSRDTRPPPSSGWGTLIPLGLPSRSTEDTGIRVTDLSEYRSLRHVPNEAIGLGFFLGVSLSALSMCVLTTLVPDTITVPVLVGVGFVSLVMAVYCHRTVF